MKLRGRAKQAHCDFVQMCLASAFWLSVTPLNYLFYKADYVFTLAGQSGVFFSLQNCLLFFRMLSFFCSASPFSASHFLCLFAGIWHCLEKD